MQGDVIELVVRKEDAGQTVRTVLKNRLGVSRRLLARLRRTEAGITVNGRQAWTSDRVAAGDRIKLRMEAEAPDDVPPREMPLNILYEDPHLLVLDKPAGIVVHPTKGYYDNTLANGVIYHWMKRGEAHRFRPVHRLDKDTSGVLAVAKNPYVHQQLAEQMKRGRIGKRYIAFVRGVPSPVRGTVDAPIDRDPAAPHLRIVTPDGYPSVTHYNTEAVYGGGRAAKVVLTLETGRTHQIRVHMRHIGCPLIADELYGPCGPDDPEWLREAARTAGRQALHAAELELRHPMTGEWMRFVSPLPGDLLGLERLLASLDDRGT
ncbi:MAG: RNA pseudouridine synthase [Thermobacillus sp. ZCTH02-B1]|uniref:RluA family pseudouridine synthase n=1 Tax=Thermobacillus sp. ZCTH02-B1 TaxID=1858795 RepID=UPI000B56C840|nr:RluA family pseudouridine synthase [Thermobacillus sp. ZCTH02-B1]OUM95468.1 MAG: RNA pseudouridine synthase [Thermobacillus sp. ZCTH02-B1]